MKHSKQLVVGMDIKDLRIAKTGQKTVTEELYRQFLQLQDDSIRFVFFDSSRKPYTGRKKSLILLEHLRHQTWKQVIIPIKAWLSRCDIVFCGDYFVPYIHLGFKTVEIFYDAFFFEYPEHYNRQWLKIFHYLAVPAARRCSYIMTITDYSRNKIHGYTGIPLEKIVTIYPGPKSLAKPADRQPLPAKFNIAEGQRYILHVGVMEKRKNLPRLIDAFGLLKKQYPGDLKLVLVGEGNGKIFSDDADNVREAVRRSGLEKEVILLGYLPDEEVAIVYEHAFMYVFPSFNEGFGIPIMEAFKFGIPVLAANNSCLPEVGGDAIITFDPFDPQDICDKMAIAMNSQSLRDGLVARGYERLHSFSWKKAARELVDVFKRVQTGAEPIK